MRRGNMAADLAVRVTVFPVTVIRVTADPGVAARIPAMAVGIMAATGIMAMTGIMAATRAITGIDRQTGDAIAGFMRHHRPSARGQLRFDV